MSSTRSTRPGDNPLVHRALHTCTRSFNILLPRAGNNEVGWEHAFRAASPPIIPWEGSQSAGHIDGCRHHYTYRENSSFITTTISVAFVQIARSLNSTHIHIADTWIDVDTSPGVLAPIAGGIVPFLRSEELNVGYPDSPGIEVAAFLSGVLEEGGCLVRARFNNEDDIYESWQPVIHFLPILIRIRNAEREAAVNAGTVRLDNSQYLP